MIRIQNSWEMLATDLYGIGINTVRIRNPDQEVFLLLFCFDLNFKFPDFMWFYGCFLPFCIRDGTGTPSGTA